LYFINENNAKSLFLSLSTVSFLHNGDNLQRKNAGLRAFFHLDTQILGQKLKALKTLALDRFYKISKFKITNFQKFLSLSTVHFCTLQEKTLKKVCFYHSVRFISYTIP